ncbi:ABC transporter permease [Pseudonocardia zijingensis]|uniref:ABC transporter permease n=1 Tax=Pseudonocardia zijingensis TaxID=153376 RepID=UPI00361F5BDD
MRVGDRALAAAGVLAVLALAELIGRAGWGGVGWPPATAVLRYLTEPQAQQLLGRALAATGAAAGTGFVLGTAVALLVTALGALLPAAAPGLDRLAAVLHAVPLIAVGPLLITIAGRDATPMLVAALAAGFAVFVAATSALAATNAAQRDVFAVLGAGRLVTLLRLQLPAGVPLIVDGLTLAAPAAVLGAVIGEWFGARRGIGVLLVSSMQNLQVEQLWAAALTAAAVSLVAYVLLVALRGVVNRRFS